MDAKPREVSTRQVRIVIVAVGALALLLAIMMRKQSDETRPTDGSGTTPVVDASVDSGAIPSPDSEFAQGLQDPELDWRTVAELGGVTIDNVESALVRADNALAERRWTDPPGDNALEWYLAIRAFDPDNEEADEGLELIQFMLLEDLRAAIESRDIELSKQIFSFVDLIGPDDEVDELADRLSRLKQAAALVEQGRLDLENDRIVQPTGDNALARLIRARELDPEHPELPELLASLETVLVERGLQSARDHEFRDSDRWMAWAGRVRGGSKAVDEASATIKQYRDTQLFELSQQARSAIRLAQFQVAEGNLATMRNIGGGERELAALVEELRLSRIYGNHRPGQVFNDPFLNGAGSGPDLVVIPVGSFRMGAESGEPDASEHEGPAHRVEFNEGFAMATTEVTVGQFSRFVDATGYETEAERKGYTSIYNQSSGRISRSRRATWRDGFDGKGSQQDDPVLHVSWNDAKAYVEWLSEGTGMLYRLPTEAEFEYALRAGTDTRYWWGSADPEETVENTTGDGDRSRQDRFWTKSFKDYNDGYWGPAPVASFEPNPYLLFDMAGNVQEWVEDCWHDTYVRAPADGSAWVNRGCDRRVVRGGFWGGLPSKTRSAFRAHYPQDQRGSSIGFRVARSLLQPRTELVSREDDLSQGVYSTGTGRLPSGS